MELRPAEPADAATIAELHAESWRRHYRGAYADSYLDGDIVADRHQVWSARLTPRAADRAVGTRPAPTAADRAVDTRPAPPAADRAVGTRPAPPAADRAVGTRLAPTVGDRAGGDPHTMTVLAEDEGEPVGFVHVVFDADPRWGSLIDNLHVRHGRQRGGIGTALMARAADAVRECATGGARYLWVLEQNVAAQGFYLALGGRCVEQATVGAPGGVASRLCGSPRKLRFCWDDAPAGEHPPHPRQASPRRRTPGPPASGQPSPVNVRLGDDRISPRRGGSRAAAD